jgi:dephospho-CoA kinase
VVDPASHHRPFIGLTGAVAAGKSEALAAFARLGAATLSSDDITHELLADPEIRDRLVDRWGDQVVVEGRVARDRVGEIVFGGAEELGWLEALLHPLVGRRVVEWRREIAPDTSLAVVEVPLLFEAGLDGAFDATVSVVAADPTRAARAAERGTALFEDRSGRQLSQDEKAARATHVIHNDGSLADLERAVAALLPILGASAGEGE